MYKTKIKRNSSKSAKTFREEVNENPLIVVEGQPNDHISETIERTRTHTFDERQRQKLAFKLNFLKDKEARYVSHKTFLTRCVQNRIIPIGLSINVEPTIGNHDEEFLDNWYKKLESFSLSLIEDIVKFCDKTLESVKTEPSQTETELQQNTDKTEFDLIKTTIQRNE